MADGRSFETSVERLLGTLVGCAVARTLVKQAAVRADAWPLEDDPEEVGAFVRGPLLDVLAPLVGRSEAARLACKVERSIAEERDWPVPDEDLLARGRRSFPHDDPGSNEQ